jgi:hypothetical protein
MDIAQELVPDAVLAAPALALVTWRSIRKELTAA